MHSVFTVSITEFKSFTKQIEKLKNLQMSTRQYYLKYNTNYSEKQKRQLVDKILY